MQMIEQAFAAARTFGRALLLLDRYFLSIPALQQLAASDESVHIVTKVKNECRCLRKPEPKPVDTVDLATVFVLLWTSVERMENVLAAGLNDRRSSALLPLVLSLTI